MKGRLQGTNLRKVFEDIASVRALAAHARYLQYGSKPKEEGEPRKLIVSQLDLPPIGPPPRAFVFAYEQTGWRDINSFQASLEAALTKTPAHLHGIAVLKSNWFVSQEAHVKKGVKLEARQGNALLEFTRVLTHCVASMPMAQASIDRYLRPTSLSKQNPDHQRRNR